MDKKRDLLEFEQLEGLRHNRHSIKNTLAMGLYARFCSNEELKSDGWSSIFIDNNPLEFEHFVASIIETVRGGSTYVTPSSGDFGVDFEHSTNDVYLGQVKCYKSDLSYEPIALVHSNMVKRNAIGGYVITTGSFSDNAYHYARNLNIELIDGVKLVELWMNSVTIPLEERNLTFALNNE